VFKITAPFRIKPKRTEGSIMINGLFVASIFFCENGKTFVSIKKGLEELDLYFTWNSIK
jgi:hypothetical protein